jgi:dissimilatory sulfite reductase related protein
MPEKQIAGVSIDVDDIGYMTNPDQWTEDIARALAGEVGIENLTDKHFEILKYIQDEYRKGTALTIRKIGKSGITNIKEFYELFPEGPLKKASLIAGIPKPVGCI